ncbi:MAG: hypothetical protein JSS21_08705, partial [Proteobacteria bacterium]|nr:hypothetical protein [Pseudomonadota bacterium]
DVNAALGPFGRPLRAGDVLKPGETGDGNLKSQPCGNGGRPNWSIDPRPWFDAEAPLRLLPGSHAHLLDGDSRAALFERAFRVGNDSNRVGVRLQGVHLKLSAPFEMTSEGCVAGTLQLPPAGEPVALGVEHPVSGGYPRIGQIAAVDLPRLAQCRPGDALRFVPCTPEDALRMLRKRERRLQELETAIAKRLAEA